MTAQPTNEDLMPCEVACFDLNGNRVYVLIGGTETCEDGHRNEFLSIGLRDNDSDDEVISHNEYREVIDLHPYCEHTGAPDLAAWADEDPRRHRIAHEFTGLDGSGGQGYIVLGHFCFLSIVVVVVVVVVVDDVGGPVQQSTGQVDSGNKAANLWTVTSNSPPCKSKACATQ